MFRLCLTTPRSRIVPASTKCPSGDTSRGWVVQVPDGRLLTTAKCFPALSDEQNLEVKVSVGAAVPTHRLREKVTLRKLDDLSAVDGFAKELWTEGNFLPKHLAALAVKLGPKGGGSQSLEFLTGAYTHGGVTGIRNNTHDHSWVSRYLADSQHVAHPFAAVGLVLNKPVVAGGGGLWHQSTQEHPNAQPQACEIKQGTSLQGSFAPYASHEPLAFDARQWHSSSKTSAPQLLLIGYTPRMLHKLDPASRCMLWKQEMRCLPGTKDEYWSTNCDSASSHATTRAHVAILSLCNVLAKRGTVSNGL